MKKTVLTVAGATVLCLPAVSTAIEITDYTFPVSAYQEAFVEGQLSTNSGNQDQTSYKYNLFVDYEAVYSSMPRTWRLRFDGLADGSRGPTKSDLDRSQKNIVANALGTVDNYFYEDNTWFWFGSGDLGYRDEAEDVFAKAGVGIGYGRIINATALAKVLRVEEELREDDLLSGSISDDVYLELAKVIDREDEFKSKYGSEEYKQHWFDAFEEILKREGLVKGDSLGASGALRMDRVLFDEAISIRRHGWVVRAGAGLVLQDFNGETDNDPSLDLVFEYAMPIGLKSQFDNILSYSTIMADDTDQIVRNQMSYTYEITDRHDWENRWDLTYLTPGSSELEDTLTNKLSTTYRYYLTNRVSLGATLALTDVEDNIDDNGNDDTDVGTFFNIRYRLK